MTEERGNYAMSVIDSVDLQSVQATMGKIAKFQAVIQNTLKLDHDYGKIPGTDKPTLLKPGAEKILMLMGLTSQYEVTEKVEDYETGFFAYTVRCSLSKGGFPITEGLGHANTKEARYARRWLTEKKLPEGIDKNSLQKREKKSRYNDGTYTEYLVENDDPFTLVNTVLKMAKKRAQVDAALTVGSLSELFTQDLEDIDLPEQPAERPKKQKENRPEPPKPKTNGNGKESLATEAQCKAVYAISKNQGMNEEEVKEMIMAKYGKESSKELTKKEASALIDELQRAE